MRCRAARRFCPESNDLLYPKEDRERKRLVYFCRSCGYQEDVEPTEWCVFRNEVHHTAKEKNVVLQVRGAGGSMVGLQGGKTGAPGSCFRRGGKGCQKCAALGVSRGARNGGWEPAASMDVGKLDWRATQSAWCGASC